MQTSMFSRFLFVGTGELAVGQLLNQVISDKLHLGFVMLQLEGLLAACLARSFLEGENSVVEELAEGVIEELADGHLFGLVCVLHVLEHLFEHVGVVARLHPLLLFLLLLSQVIFGVGVELDFIEEGPRVIRLLVAVLELRLH